MRQRSVRLTDAQWAKIEPPLPRPFRSTKGGRPRVPPRDVVDGILWVLKTGARAHDGHCERHGAEACKTLRQSPDLQATLARGGVLPVDYDAIEAAVTMHSCGELSRTDPNRRLSALLKDADALDRVRLGDSDVGRLRHPGAKSMVQFATWLWEETVDAIPESPNYFERLWPEALRILGTCS